MADEVTIEPPSAQPKWRRRTSAVISILCWVYSFSVLALWLFLRFDGTRSWVDTVAMFSPRWIVALPLIPLIPPALLFHRRSLVILTIGLLIAVFPIMGLCLPWGRLQIADSTNPSIRVLTCNIHHAALDTARLADVIASDRPDVVCLQEWTPSFESTVFENTGWNVVVRGETCLASRFPIHSARELSDGAAVHYTIDTPGGLVDVFDVHLASPHAALRDTVLGMPNAPDDLERNTQDRQVEAQELNRLTQNRPGPLLIVGDFNLPSDSQTFRENFGALTDCFATAGFGFGWTYYSRWTTVRIDHILCNGQWNCRRCWVGPNVGSPHRPLIADLTIRQSR